MKRFFLAVCLIASAALAASCSGGGRLPMQTLAIYGADGALRAHVEAEIAKTPEERSKGYMERTSIPAGTGMLFVFERDQILSFWMKNTPTPLSIAYIDSRGVIRDIFDMTPFSLANVTSTRSVRYALEVPQGWFAAQGI